MRRALPLHVVWITVAVAAALVLAACGGSGSASPSTSRSTSPSTSARSLATASTAPATVTPTAQHPCGFRSTPPSRYGHVIWIWFENHSYDQVVGHMPYLDRVAKHCGLATNFHSLAHPSLPNYIAATSGAFHGIHTDCEPTTCPVRARSIFGQLQNAGKRWKGYAESMPQPCDRVTSGSYAARHNPPVYYSDVRRCHRRDVALRSTTGLRHDLASDRLPAYASVTPNICNDMHDCSVATGDRWLATWMPRIFSSAAWSRGRTAVFVTFDEGVSGGSCSAYPRGCHIATWVFGPAVRPGTTSGLHFTLYSLLKTTERMLGLRLLGHAADRTTRSMRHAFNL